VQDGQRLRRVTDGQRGFLVIDPETQRKSVRLDRGTKLGTDQSTVPYSVHAWEEDVEVKLTPDQIRRVAYAADRELRIVRGEYSVKQWIDLKDQERVGWRLPADADALRVALNSDVTMRLAGK
jgi:hypothetical protein